MQSLPKDGTAMSSQNNGEIQEKEEERVVVFDPSHISVNIGCESTCKGEYEDFDCITYMEKVAEGEQNARQA
jgi:hypothetical protein